MSAADSHQLHATSEKAVHRVEDPVGLHGDGKDIESMSTAEQHFDPQVAKRVLRKIDFRLLPVVILLHTVSLIDRTNISAARIAGMDKDLGLDKGNRASIVLLTFFIGYITLDIPSNILIRKIGVAKYLGFITFSWGAVTMGIGFVHSWKAAAALRAMIGVFEAGNTPGSIFLVSSWYRKYEVQSRLGYYYLLSVALAAFSQLLAYGIIQIGHHTAWNGWRWLYIIEGSATCVLGMIAYFFLIDFPDSPKNKFLSPEEKEFVAARLAAERGSNEQHQVSWQSLVTTLSDWKVWAYTYIYMTATMGAYAFTFFLPIILRHSMGYSQTLSLLLAVPPAFCAVIFSLIINKLSDKFRMRAPFIVLQASIGILGLGMTGYLKAAGPRYVGTFFGYSGVNGIIPCALAWQANNCREGRKRAVSSALQVMFGATGGIIASLTYRQQDAPEYIPGITTNMAVLAVTIILAILTALRIHKLNKDANEGKRILEQLQGFRYVW